MTRKDFELIARTLKQTRSNYTAGHVAQDVLDEVSHQFAGELADTNPRFDRARFLAACGVAQ